MAIRVTAQIQGNARAFFDDIPRETLAKATQVAVTAATRGLQEELRQHVTAAYPAFARYANAIRSRVYPQGQSSLRAAGFVHPRGQQAKRVFAAHASGATIFPRVGRALAIPLHNQRTRAGKRGPRNFGQKLTFIPFKRSVNLLGVLATKAPRTARRGTLTAAGRRARGTVARRGISATIGDRYVPQFLLVRRTKLPRAFDTASIMQKWTGAVPGLIARALPR